MRLRCRIGLHSFTYSARVFPDGSHRAVRQCRLCDHYREWFGRWEAVHPLDRGPWRGQGGEARADILKKCQEEIRLNGIPEHLIPKTYEELLSIYRAGMEDG